MIDYFFRWASSSDAKADAFAAAQRFGRFYDTTTSTAPVWAWARDHVLPNVQAWRPSQDSTTVSVSTINGSTIRTVTHNYLTGYFAIVSVNNLVPVLLNSTALAFALNRDGPPYIVKNNIGAVLSDVACQPVFAGSHYPIGGYST